MPDPDDQPFPHTTRNGGAAYWIQVARENLGPRRARATADRPSRRCVT